jgi:hypothetical protein
MNRSILKKSRHIGFGVFIVHSSMGEMIDHLTNMPLWQGLPTLMGQLVSYFPGGKKYVSLPPGE